MICLFEAFFDKPYKKIETSKNYIIQDFENPKKSQIAKYRSKVVVDKNGKKHILRFAILNKKGKKISGKKTSLTSVWHPKEEESAQIELKK